MWRWVVVVVLVVVVLVVVILVVLVVVRHELGHHLEELSLCGQHLLHLTVVVGGVVVTRVVVGVCTSRRHLLV